MLSAHGSGCVLKKSGEVWCNGNWGSRVPGAPVRAPEVPRRIAPLPSAVFVSGGDWTGCAITTERSVWCWGANRFFSAGQRGRPQAPAQVQGLSDVVKLSIRDDQVCALDSKGLAWCWGRLAAPLEGARRCESRVIKIEGGTRIERPSCSPRPLRLPFEEGEVVDLAAGVSHACVARRDGTVWCWGDNDGGQLGDGTLERGDAFVQAVGVRGVVRVSVGERHSCALTAAGEVWCWGGGVRVGNGNSKGSRLPKPARLDRLGSDVKQLWATGEWHSCAVKGDGELWCWGAANWGQLGNGKRFESWPEPQRVEMPGPVAEVVTGVQHTCARLRNDEVWCWGEKTPTSTGPVSGDWPHTARPLLSALSCE